MRKETSVNTRYKKPLTTKSKLTRECYNVNLGHKISSQNLVEKLDIVPNENIIYEIDNESSCATPLFKCLQVEYKQDDKSKKEQLHLESRSNISQANSESS